MFSPKSENQIFLFTFTVSTFMGVCRLFWQDYATRNHEEGSTAEHRKLQMYLKKCNASKSADEFPEGCNAYMATCYNKFSPTPSYPLVLPLILSYSLVLPLTLSYSLVFSRRSTSGSREKAQTKTRRVIIK